jgi:hypothetical protein
VGELLLPSSSSTLWDEHTQKRFHLLLTFFVRSNLPRDFILSRLSPRTEPFCPGNHLAKAGSLQSSSRQLLLLRHSTPKLGIAESLQHAIHRWRSCWCEEMGREETGGYVSYALDLGLD